MPEIGEIRKAREIERYAAKGNGKFIWHACVDCGKERWVQLVRGKPRDLKCRDCGHVRGECHPNYGAFGELNHRWKGGRQLTKGYISVKLYPDDFFYPMATNKGYVLEHRLVVAKALGRCLLPHEIVHHKGKKYSQGSIENKSDNRYPENLELLPDRKYHLVDTVSRSRIAQLQKRVTLLEAENVLLRKTNALLHT